MIGSVLTSRHLAYAYHNLNTELWRMVYRRGKKNQSPTCGGYQCEFQAPLATEHGVLERGLNQRKATAKFVMAPLFLVTVRSRVTTNLNHQLSPYKLR